MSRTNPLLQAFEALEINPASFGHQQHLEVAFAMLDKYTFMDACIKYGQTIHQIAARAGAKDKFNVTVTFAFMSLVAERKNQFAGHNFDAFLAANADLLDRNVLQQWYSADRLNCATARQLFLLPDRHQQDVSSTPQPPTSGDGA